MVLNLSFAAAGFLGAYHLGITEALLRHGDKLLSSLKACAGASAGALHCKEFTYRFACNVRSQRFGAVTPGYDFMLELRLIPGLHLSPSTHRKPKIHVSITHSKTRKNSMVSSFTSREELIKVFKHGVNGQ
uniref:Patatin-like phospholipase domain containing 4 n=1 Tax=Sinocyclocheilus anshuiensis TaxID=1608454 RepID=A0A671T2U6_9TELE